MVNINLLKSEIVKNGMTQEQFCKKIGMSHSTFIRKIKKGIFNTDEAATIAKVLNVKDPSEIFFAYKLT